MTIINGTNGNDILMGTSSTGDIINGFQGNDLIQAGPGDDIINAGDGNNILSAGSGTDLLFAGAGNNTFYAGPGNAVFSAGGGKNNVFIAPLSTSTPEGGGKYWIAGFHSGDIIHLEGFPDIHSFSDLQNYLTVSGANTVIDVSAEIGQPRGSEVITILNYAQPQPMDFSFLPETVVLGTIPAPSYATGPTGELSPPHQVTDALSATGVLAELNGAHLL